MFLRELKQPRAIQVDHRRDGLRVVKADGAEQRVLSFEPRASSSSACASAMSRQSDRRA